MKFREKQSAKPNNEQAGCSWLHGYDLMEEGLFGILILLSIRVYFVKLNIFSNSNPILGSIRNLQI